MTLKVVQKLAMTYTQEKINQQKRRKAGTEILMRLLEQYLELLSVFKKQAER
jgi:hypothetical protein